MNTQNQRNLLVRIASLAGVASASTLLSLPAMALTNFQPKSFSQSLNSSNQTAQSKPVSQQFLLAKQSSDNSANNTGSKPTTIRTERGVCKIPARKPTGGSTRRTLQAERNCNPGAQTIPSNTNSPQKTPPSGQ